MLSADNDGGCAQIEPAKILADGGRVADDERRQPGGIQMARRRGA